LYRHVNAGTIPAQKVGKLWKLDPAALRAFMVKGIPTDNPDAIDVPQTLAQIANTLNTIAHAMTAFQASLNAGLKGIRDDNATARAETIRSGLRSIPRL